jgi:DNA-binding SARP family transcriptional activator
MEIRLLGPVELICARGAVPIRSEKQRALLAFLALHPHRFVTNDTLVDALWGDDPPDGTIKALRFHVSRLRGVLRQADAADALQTRPGGYVLAVAENSVDVLVFERAIAAARSARSDGAAPDAVSRAFRDALDLWFGPALADIDGEPFVDGERRRLEELHLLATEDYFTAELAGGRHAEAVGELERLVDRHPLRERLWELLITALYRSGRQADALAAYQRVRRILADELGIEPSGPLRQLEHEVLVQDAGLAAPSAGPRPAWHANGDEPTTAAAGEEPPPSEATVRPPRGLATAALALGVVALGLIWLGVASMAIAVLAAVSGTIAASRATTANKPADRRATTGIIAGAVAFSGSLGLLVYRHVTDDSVPADSKVAASTEVSSESTTDVSRDGPPEGRPVSIEALEVGNCLNLRPGTAPPDQTGGISTAEAAPIVLLVPCEQPHEQEVYDLFEFPVGPYPGDAQVQALARGQCAAQFEEYVGIAPERSRLDFVYVWPAGDEWVSGIRRAGCSLFEAWGRDLTGTTKGSRR